MLVLTDTRLPSCWRPSACLAEDAPLRRAELLFIERSGRAQRLEALEVVDEPFLGAGPVLLGRDEIARDRRRDRTEQPDPEEHEGHRRELALGRHRHRIAI